MKIGQKIKKNFTLNHSYKVFDAALLTEKEREKASQISSPEQLLDFISDYNHRLIKEGNDDRFSVIKYKGKQEIYGKTISLPYPVTYNWEAELSGFYSKKAIPFELEEHTEAQHSQLETYKNEITEEEFLAEIGEKEVEEETSHKEYNSCSSCDTPLALETEFCSCCGKSQDKTDEEKEETTLIQCKSCEELLAPDTRFCSACGFEQTPEQRQVPEESILIQCKNCEKLLEPSTHYCSVCGFDQTAENKQTTDENDKPELEKLKVSTEVAETPQKSVVSENITRDAFASQRDIQDKFELNDQLKSLLRRSDIEHQVSMELEGKKKLELEIMMKDTQEEREKELLDSQKSIDEKFDLAVVEREKEIEKEFQEARFREVNVRMRAQQSFVSNLVEKLGNFLENG